jgi:DNA-binding response OmpR family regulator
MFARSYAMDKRRVLILDTDPDTLIPLQQLLEQAGLDTTITWDEMEACQLLGAGVFDLILIGDHRPELDAAAVIGDFSFRGICPPVLILKGKIGEKDSEHFRWLGAVGVVAKADAPAVLDQVTKILAPVQFRTRSAKAGSSLRTAS